MNIYEHAILKLEEEVELQKLVLDIIMCLNSETYIEDIQKIIDLMADRLEVLDHEFRDLKSQF